MNLKRSNLTNPGYHIFSGTARIFLAESMVFPIGLLTAAYLTRRLGPSNYGLYTLAGALVAWLEWTITSMFSAATIKFVGEAKDWTQVGTTAVRLYGAAGAITGLCLLLLSYPLALLFSEPQFTWYLMLLALDIPIFCLAHAHTSLLIGLGAFRERAIASIGRWTIKLVLIICFVEMGFSITGAIMGWIGGSLMELIVGRHYVRPSLFGQSNFPLSRLWSYSLPVAMFILSIRLFDKLDLFGLKALGGTAAQAGIYAAAQNLTLIPGIFALSFSPLILSTLSRLLYRGETEKAREVAQGAMRAVILLLPLAGICAGAASEIVRLVFGAAFMPAAPLLALLIFGSIALVMISLTTNIFIALGKPAWTFGLVGPILPVALVGHILMIPRLGPLGAAMVTTCCAGCTALVTIFALYFLWKILPPAVSLLRSTVACIVAYTLAIMWPVSPFWLPLKLLILTLACVLVLVGLGEFTFRQIAGIKTLWARQTVI